MAINMDTLLRLRVAVKGDGSIKRLSGQIDNLKGSAAGVTSGFKAMQAASAALASSAVVAGLTGIIKSSIDAGDELNNLQMKTGIAVDKLLGLRAAARLGDVDMETLSKGINKLNIVVAQASTGSSKAAAKIEGLGVSIRDSTGKVASTDVILKRLADRFRDMPDGAKKTAAAINIFGKSGAELIPMLNEGSKAMDAFNVKIGADFAARSDQFNDTLTMMGLRTEAMGLQLTDALLPALQSILNEFNNLFNTKEDWGLLFESIKVGVRGIATAIFATIKLITQLVRQVQTLAGAFGAVTAGDFAGAFNIIKERLSSGIEQAQQDFASLGRMWQDAPSPPSSARRGGVEADLRAMRGGSPTGTRGASGAADLPQYIDKSVLRQWLISQGFGRTSGDFTNAGHRTPNHMLNAMDMGVMTGSYDAAVRKTAAMEEALRATGAFGTQLFGPVRDPRGHKDHLHVPTPGGKVKMTPGLAQLMGLNTGVGGWREFQQTEERAIEEAERLRQKTEDQLLTSRERLAVAESNLRISEAETEEQKLQAKFDAERSERITRNAALLRDSLSVEERGNILKAQYRDGLAAEMDLEAKLKEIRQKSYEDFIALREQQMSAISEMGDAMGSRAFSTPDIQAPGTQFTPFAGYVDGIGSMNDALNNLATSGFKGIEDAMVSLATTGKANFREFAAAMLEDTARIIIQQLVLKTILSAIGGAGPNYNGIQGFNPGMGDLRAGMFGSVGAFDPGTFSMPSFSPGLGFANGGAFSRNGIVPFARGGIVHNPTLFRFANGGSFGTGMMGEAGPEAIIPLKRGRDGRLGVSGGGDVSISVQVNAGGTPAENDGTKARELAQIVAQTVKAEIVRQKRPGGVLS